MLTLKNEMTYFKKSLTTELLKFFFEGKLEEEIDKIPINRFPKHAQSMDCCIFKDRAMARYKIMALLGINIEKEDDETKPLSFFLKKALEREKIDCPVLTVIDIACHSCSKGHYYVTELCQGCSARPCEVNCPVGAIEIINGRSVINQEKCIKCGKCREVCPYNAIVYKPVPCEENCPVGAISRNPATGKAEIDYDKCIYCGKCTVSCPFGAIMNRSQIIDVAKHLKNGKKMVAMVAPSIVGQFPGSVNQIVSSLKKLGFSKVYEVAYGADLVAQREANELSKKVFQGEQKMLGTSCCPAYVEAVRKHVPDFLKYVSETPTPMSLTAKIVKSEDPNCITVFIGPCIAKKYEGIHDKNVDYVLTFEELGSFFIAKDIEVAEQNEEKFNSPRSSKAGRKFPVSGGVADAVRFYLSLENKDKQLNYLKIDGLNKRNINVLKNIAKGKTDANLIEVMSCEGGCVYGPGVVSNPKIASRKVISYAEKEQNNED